MIINSINCKNHIRKRGYKKCRTCNENLCLDCFQKKIVYERKKSYSFCSDRCQDIFKVKVKARKSINRKKALKYYIIGISSILSGLTVIYFLEMPGINEKVNSHIISELGKITIGGGIISICYGLYATIYGDNPDDLESPFF